MSKCFVNRGLTPGRSKRPGSGGGTRGGRNRGGPRDHGPADGGTGAPDGAGSREVHRAAPPYAHVFGVHGCSGSGYDCIQCQHAIWTGAGRALARRAGRADVAMTRKRVLVTGGAGFLGSHLCERLLRDGHDVLCVGNYFTGRKDNIAHLLGRPQFEAMRHDITFPLYVEVDEIYNLACPASPVHYQFDPVQTTKTSVVGAINMLGLAKRTGAKILQASTSAVYGARPSIRRPRATAAASIRSARGPATTRASAAPRRCSSTTTASTGRG